MLQNNRNHQCVLRIRLSMATNCVMKASQRRQNDSVLQFSYFVIGSVSVIAACTLVTRQNASVIKMSG